MDFNQRRRGRQSRRRACEISYPCPSVHPALSSWVIRGARRRNRGPPHQQSEVRGRHPTPDGSGPASRVREEGPAIPPGRRTRCRGKGPGSPAGGAHLSFYAPPLDVLAPAPCGRLWANIQEGLKKQFFRGGGGGSKPYSLPPEGGDRARTPTTTTPGG